MSTMTIHRYARNNELAALNKAIATGVNINEKDQFGATALHYSISENNYDITRSLLEHGADVMVQDDNGATALHYAVEYNAYDAAELLVKQSQDVINIADKHGNQPLWTAVFNARGSHKLVDLLLRCGADAMHQNNTKVTPLDLANRMGDGTLTLHLERSLDSE